jgi:hypothetical protein
MNMNKTPGILLAAMLLAGPATLRAGSADSGNPSAAGRVDTENAVADPESRAAFLAADVKAETLRTWHAYTEYAWPHDDLLPISRKFHDRYGDSISIAPIDAYSTLRVMGFADEARRIEDFVVNDLSFDKDDYVKVFEVNIRILGGLLCMYEMSGDARILEKARQFGDKLLPAFQSPTGLPYYYVNLRTGATKGRVVCWPRQDPISWNSGSSATTRGTPSTIRPPRGPT